MGEHAFCPVRATMDLLGAKWTLHIIRELMGGKRRFNEIAHACGGVNSRTLTKRLVALEREGLIGRRVVSQIPPWVEYDLTDKGRMLSAVVESIAAWGRCWMRPPPAAKRTKTAQPPSA